MSDHPILTNHYSRFLGPNPPDPHSTYKPSTATTTKNNSPVFSSPFGPLPPSPPDLNIHDLCFPPGNPLPPDYPLIINADTGESLSLHNFYARTCALARVLRHDGPNPLHLRRSPRSDRDAGGDIVGLLSRNHIHYPSVVHACLRAGVVFGGISPASTAHELWWVLRKMQISGLVVHESLLGVVGEAVGLGTGEGDGHGLKLVLEMRKVVVLCEDAARDEVDGCRTVESLVREGMGLAERPRERVGGRDVAYLFQSSGTSGLPKAMIISHSNGVYSGIQTLTTATQTALFAGLQPFAAHSVTLGVIPMYHSYGMILWNLRVNLVPNTTILLPKWSVEAALRAIEKYRITALPLVPPLVRQLALSPLTAKYDLSSVVAAVSGAAYLPPDVAVQLAQKLPQGAASPVPSGYGLSEAASIASPVAAGLFGLAQPPSADEAGCIGWLLPGMEGRVVDAATQQDVGVDEPGELWVRGPVVTPGYFKDAAATADLFAEPGGWLRTGDLVRRDRHDRLFYLDRLKELIKVKGLQVAATEVEDALLAHPDALARDACVAGVDNGRGDGSVFVRAWVVLSAAGRAAGDDEVARRLAAWVQQRLSRHKWLTGGVEVVEEIPRTPSGKMLRREMRDRYHARLKRESQAKL
ncbi:AMP-binding enzyme [Stagonosporopsis vannaccii]|nr:AMP-binding enzyme [Stagonosporopsis vannaccii]